MVQVLPANIGLSICYAVAVLSTFFRLLHRKWVRRLWWDDFWAFMALMTIIPLWISSFSKPRYLQQDRGLYIARCLVTLTFYSCSLWAARLSIAVTIVRLCPKGDLRVCCKIGACTFGALCLTFIAHRIFMCGSFSPERLAKCTSTRWVVLLEVGADLVADMWLLGISVYIFMRRHMAQNERKLVIAIFTCTIFTGSVSIVHAVFKILRKGKGVSSSQGIQSALSLIVCDILAVVALKYRVFYEPEDGCIVSERRCAYVTLPPGRDNRVGTGWIVSSVNGHRGFGEPLSANIDPVRSRDGTASEESVVVVARRPAPPLSQMLPPHANLVASGRVIPVITTVPTHSMPAAIAPVQVFSHAGTSEPQRQPEGTRSAGVMRAASDAGKQNSNLVRYGHSILVTRPPVLPFEPPPRCRSV